MIRPIVKDILFLQQKAEKAGWQDAAVGRDLLDTLAAHIDTCVGMAANMIGSTKAIIAVREENHLLLMYNPKIILHPLTSYKTEEGCLCLFGRRLCRRYDYITVRYEDENFHKKKKQFEGFTAEIVQHEIDHLQGILI